MTLRNNCPEVVTQLAFEKLFGVEINFADQGLDEQLELTTILSQFPIEDPFLDPEIHNGQTLEGIQRTLDALDRNQSYIFRTGTTGAGHFHFLSFEEGSWILNSGKNKDGSDRRYTLSTEDDDGNLVLDAEGAQELIINADWGTSHGDNRFDVWTITPERAYALANYIARCRAVRRDDTWQQALGGMHLELIKTDTYPFELEDNGYWASEDDLPPVFGSDEERQDYLKDLLVYQAVTLDNVDSLKLLLALDGVNVNDPYPPANQTLLHMAVNNSSSAVVRELIKENADLRAEDSNGNSVEDIFEQAIQRREVTRREELEQELAKRHEGRIPNQRRLSALLVSLNDFDEARLLALREEYGRLRLRSSEINLPAILGNRELTEDERNDLTPVQEAMTPIEQILQPLGLLEAHVSLADRKAAVEAELQVESVDKVNDLEAELEQLPVFTEGDALFMRSIFQTDKIEREIENGNIQIDLSDACSLNNSKGVQLLLTNKQFQPDELMDAANTLIDLTVRTNLSYSTISNSLGLLVQANLSAENYDGVDHILNRIFEEVCNKPKAPNPMTSAFEAEPDLGVRDLYQLLLAGYPKDRHCKALEDQAKVQINRILDEYLQQRESVRDSAGNVKQRFWGGFFAWSASSKTYDQKVEAIGKLREALENGHADFTNDNIATLENGKLGQDLGAFIKSGDADVLCDGNEVRTIREFIGHLQTPEALRPPAGGGGAGGGL